MITSQQTELLLELQQADINKPVRFLYENYFEGIIAQVCANGGTREDGADIFQEAVIILVDKVKTGSFRGESSIKTFLTAVAKNTWLMEMRTRNRRNVREIKYMKSAETIVEISDRISSKPTNESLNRVFNEIGETCKGILMGVYYKNKSMRELLNEFNYENEQVLRNKKSKCMKKLKNLLITNKELLQNLKNLSLYE
jgi:RNA polymerase sigma factor (sigma-70 family)